MADPHTDTPHRDRCKRARLLRLVLALLCALALPCAAAQSRAASAEEASRFDLEAPAVRSLLERALAAEAGTPAQPELAASLYCQAASFGSIEGVYRLGRMAMAGLGMARDVPMAATLFAIAAGNGHLGAAGMVLLTGVHEERLPRCLAESPP